MAMRTGAILLSLGLVFTAAAASAADMVPVRSITVNGMAKRQVVPDEAHLNVNLNSMAPKLVDAKAAHDQKLKKLMGLAKDAGIDEKKVRTQNSSVQPVYEYRDVKVDNGKEICNTTTNGKQICIPAVPVMKNVRTLMGYRAQTNIDITVGDTSKLGGLMDAVNAAGFEKGANQEWGELTSVYYSLSDPNRIRDDLLTEALNNARDKASKMAVAAGTKISRVYQIQESGTSSFEFQRPMMMRAMPMAAMAKSADESIAPPAGEQEVNASVTVMYELKD